MKKRVVILGSTGSIGEQSIEVLQELSDRFEIIGLTAHKSCKKLLSQVQSIRPRSSVLTCSNKEEYDEWQPQEWEELYDRFGHDLILGDSGVYKLVTAPETDIVIAAMVGAAGLESTIAALRANKTIALANKESLVVGGPVVKKLLAEGKGKILPVDSEHSAVFQCLMNGSMKEVSRVILTASGGPFRTFPLEQFDSITPKQALQHPTWEMGAKITIDSATMMNKALELIEAHWLFDLPADRLDVVVHPQSVVHSMVEYCDGSVVAQLSPPDMRLPIQYALTWPERLDGPAKRLDFQTLSRLDFEEPDLKRYPALELGWEVIRRGGTAGAALNAANEIAVERFLREDLSFIDITRLCSEILEHHPYESNPDLETLNQVDRWARTEARKRCISSKSFAF